MCADEQLSLELTEWTHNFVRRRTIRKYEGHWAGSAAPSLHPGRFLAGEEVPWIVRDLLRRTPSGRAGVVGAAGSPGSQPALVLGVEQ